MSADDFLHERPATPREDPYATRPLHIHEAVGTPPMAQPAPRARAARRVRHSRRPFFVIVLNTLLLLLTLAVLIVGGGLYYLDQRFKNKIYPNVSIEGLPVGELTRQQAEAALRARYEPFLRNPVTIAYGDRTWAPTAEEVGVHVDLAGAVDAAYRAGRSNGLIDNLREVKAIWDNGLELPLHVTFDQNQMHAYVQSISADLEQPPRDARLIFNGRYVVTSPAQVGRQVLVDQTVAELTDVLTAFPTTPPQVALRTRELQPRLHNTEVETAAEQIRAYIQGPLILNFEDELFMWSIDEIGSMVQVSREAYDPTTDRLVVSLDERQIERRLQWIAEETEIVGEYPRVDWNGGNLRIARPGTNGLRVDVEAAFDVVVAALSSPQRTIELPTIVTDPPVTEANLDDLGINELISIGRSDFTGSAAYRVQNIGVGMQKLNGILVAPGEEFSFNNTIGSIDAQNGFVEGYAIVQNRTQLEFGGGICQDSTTLFRAVFWAGLPITERWGHSFYISWYDKYALGDKGNGPGMDATIFTGGPDFRFVNDTGNWLLMQAWSNPNTGVAQIEFYGTKLDRQVDLTHRVYDRVPAPAEAVYIPDPNQPPGVMKQTDTARGGMTIDIYRIITENGVRQEPELFRTTFKPWPDIFLVNPVDLGPDGKPLPKPEEPVDPNAPESEQIGQPVDPNAQPVDPNAQPQPEAGN